MASTSSLTLTTSSTPSGVSAFPQAKLVITNSSETNTKVTYSWTLYFIASSAASTSSNRTFTVTINGTSTTKSYSINGKTGTYTVGTGSTSITKGTSSQSISASVSCAWKLTWSGTYVSSTSKSGALTVARMTYSTPSAPSSVAVSRTSDSSQTVTWSGNNTTSGSTTYWSGIYLYRSVDGATASLLATLGNSVKTYTDSSTSAQHKYQYYLKSYNADATSSASSTVTIYTTPAAASSVAVARNSDASHKVSWTETSSSAWVSAYVDRATDGGSFTKIATVSAGTTSYTDTSTSAGHCYQYGVRSTNSTVTASRATASTVYTTPAAPSSVALSSDGTTVTVTVTLGSSYADAVQVQESTDSGSTWTTVDSGAPSGTTYATSLTLSGTAVFRARAAKASNASTSTTLYSSYTTSSSITTLCAPNAPTVASMSSVYETGSTVTISWTPNHPDGTAQTAAQVQVVLPSGTTDTYSRSDSTTKLAITLAYEGAYSVRARTYGSYEGWGAWSSYVSFNSYYAPTVYFTAPSDGDTVDSIPCAIEWSASDSTGSLSSQSLVLCDEAGTQLYSWSLSSSASSAELSSATYIPESGASCVLTLTVRGGSGLTTSASTAFSVDYEAPWPAAVAVEYTEGLGAQLRLSYMIGWSVSGSDLVSPAVSSEEGLNDDGSISFVYAVALDEDAGEILFDYEGVEDIEYATVARLNTDGTTTLLLADADDGDGAVDYLPPLNTDYAYRVISYAASGAVKIHDVDAFVDSGGMEAFNFGSDASTAVVLGYSASASLSPEPAGELLHFADGGESGGLPLFYGTGDVDISGSRSYSVPAGDAYTALRSAALDPACAVCWLRDYWGDRMRVRASWSLSREGARPDAATVDASFSQVVWEEPAADG